ncbi:BlaI/MecI/CopY family transcriptional regulator [Actinomadura roseirufa]|uniref:BlaI/MecI/CopY family transcriptional regulator n=1 Tax=Actinomadura roseirufa TaxID=2094049 RepID=UPI001F5F9EA3|nr:BlaI/MecI/CopY family transcriptional regulator [Actinomadura roseirufa]
MLARSGGRRGRGALEAEVLAVLAAADEPLTPREVARRLDPRPAYTTVMTVLSRLYGKGVVTRARKGRGYCYVFLRDEAARRAVQMRRLLDQAREQDRARTLARFVDELSAEDERLLRRLLRDHEPGGEPSRAAGSGASE